MQIDKIADPSESQIKDNLGDTSAGRMTKRIDSDTSPNSNLNMHIEKAADALPFSFCHCARSEAIMIISSYSAGVCHSPA